ncbi:MAG: glycosyltransferase family 4 protein [Nitrosarchaeum sp.]|nr:glycosyltransferase family 4 protein [Nitrosarchaeum sp.]
MNILVIHEVDWIKKITFEPHHLAELFSLKGNNVFVIDCREPDIRNLCAGFYTKIIFSYHRIYDNSSLTIIRPPSLLIKGLNRLSYFLFCKRIIKKIIKEKKIDIILLYGVATNGIQSIQAAKDYGIPIIFRELDVAHGLIKIPVIRYLAKKCERYVLNNCNFVLTTTNDLARYVINMGTRKENVETFNLGVNLELFKPLEKDSILLDKFGMTNDDKIIVFMGTLYDFSGLDEIILNFNLLQKSITKIKLLIVGGGPSQKHLQNLIKDKNLENEIKITGFITQNEIPKYIALADVCINPFKINFVTDSILPTKILEYMSCSKPVISTSLRGTTELLPNESFGIIYSSQMNFIKTIIELLLDDKKMKKLGKNGLQYVQSNHDWNKLSEKLLKKFNDFIS